METFFLLLSVFCAIAGIIVGIVALIKQKSHYMYLLIILILGAVAYTSNSLENKERQKEITAKKGKLKGHILVKFFTANDRSVRYVENTSKDTTYVYSGGKAYHYNEIILVD